MARPDHNRLVRRENLRAMLEAGGHVQHVLDLCTKIEQNPDGPVNALKVVIDTKLKLINKFLPDLKAVEMTGADGGPVDLHKRVTLTLVDGHPSRDSESV